MTNGEISGKLPKCGKASCNVALFPKPGSEVYSDSFIVPGLCYASKTDCKIIYMGEGREGGAGLQLWAQT